MGDITWNIDAMNDFTKILDGGVVNGDPGGLVNSFVELSKLNLKVDPNIFGQLSVSAQLGASINNHAEDMQTDLQVAARTLDEVSYAVRKVAQAASNVDSNAAKSLGGG